MFVILFFCVDYLIRVMGVVTSWCSLQLTCLFSHSCLDHRVFIFFLSTRIIEEEENSLFRIKHI